MKLELMKEIGDFIYSNPYEICYFKMRLLIDLNGYGDSEGTHMSVYFQLMKGELDDLIEWPFNKKVTFILIHQDDKNKCIKRSLERAGRTRGYLKKYFGKPVNNCNAAYGFDSFIALSKLHADGFIKNDTIYIRCDIGS